MSGRSKLSVATVLLAACLVALSGCGGDGGDDGAAGDAGNAGDMSEWADAGGRWHPMRDGAFTEEQLEAMERLKSIGYLAGSSEPPEVSGVTVYDSSRAWDGLNFYTSGHLAGAILMDMHGEVLHQWSHTFLDAWNNGPGGELPKSSKGSGFWRRAYLFENGDVLAVFDGHALIKIDRDSKLIWARFGGFHHDLDVMDDGRIYVLLREPTIVPWISEEEPVLEEFVVVLDAEGNELTRVSQLEAIARSDHAFLLEGMKESGDIFHTNTVEVLDGRFEGRHPAFRKGNVLICIRELDNIAIIDMDAGLAVWGTEGPWLKQHQPTFLDDGRLLIFDNGGSRMASRILEVDPVTREIVWIYKGDAENFFHSPQCGSNQRLPNGNTLVSETDRGRAFEVTREGEIVWEYINPAQAGENGEFIASLFEVLRISPDHVAGWLEQ
jgi:hypothetical protein